MTRKLRTDLGFYSPSFMHIHVYTKLSLEDLSTIKDVETEAAYLHEFIHYIQDITTTYGLSNINIFADYMRCADLQVTGSPEKGFEVPVLPVAGGVDNVDVNLDLRSLYAGYEGADDHIIFKKHRLNSREMTLPIGKRKVPVVEVFYSKRGSMIQKKLEFGATCIVESMAYIIERCCYPSSPPSPDLPYTSAERLARLVHPTFAGNILNVLALCDVSLRDLNPGAFFYDILQKIKKRNRPFSTPDQVYAFAMANHPEFDYHGATDFDSLLTFVGDQAADQLKKYFYDPHFDSIKDWLERMVLKGVQFRLDHPTFPLDIARSGPLATNIPFARFVSEIGTPLITNDLDQLCLYDPTRRSLATNYPLIWAIDQIQWALLGEQRNCDMVGHCKLSGLSTDVRCNNSPWDRANDPAPHCPYAIMWRHWKLEGYYPL
jgi:hypothetical protein